MNASQFESRLKDIVHKLQGEFGSCQPPEARCDIVEEILLGILGRDVAEGKAHDALERLRRSMVDYNELRMASIVDVVDEVGPHFPHIEQKAQDIVAALSRIYDLLETLDLTEFKARPKREAAKWLSEIPGVDPYTLGRVLLLCFGAHSVPVNQVALGWLQHYGLFEPSIQVPEAQGVLERHVRSADAMKVFCLLQRLAEKAAPAPQAVSKPATGKKKSTAPAKASKEEKRVVRPAAKGKPAAKSAKKAKT
jgi:endonuclease III